MERDGEDEAYHHCSWHHHLVTTFACLVLSVEKKGGTNIADTWRILDSYDGGNKTVLIGLCSRIIIVQNPKQVAPVLFVSPFF